MSAFKNFFSRIWNPICAVLWFLFFQLACSTVFQLLPLNLSVSTLTIVVTLVSSILTAGILILLHYVEPLHLRYKGPILLLGLLIVLQIAASISLNLVEEWCDIPDLLQDVMLAIMKNPLGILAVTILGPITEELTFRGGVMGGLLRSGFKPATAIIVSALVFGLIHLNPIQIVFASLIGLILGWAYWQSKSLIPNILMHIANNTFSVVTFYLSDDPTARITDEIGLTWAIILMLACAIAAIMLFLFIRRRYFQH